MNESYIIAYDVKNPRRLQKIYRVLCGLATPIELSVFLLQGSDKDKEDCLQKLVMLIDVRQDDLRCYPLPARGLQKRIGRAKLPEGIHWTGLPTGF